MITSFKKTNRKINLKDVYIYMDNFTAHKTDLVRKSFTDLECNAIFAPPYSPEFNPIELYFSLLKRKRRKINVTKR